MLSLSPPGSRPNKFTTRESMLTATVERWSSRVSRPLRSVAGKHGAVAYLHALIAAYADEPALMRLLAWILAASTDAGHDGAEYYQTLYLRFRRTIRDALVEDVRVGREPATMQPERGMQRLLALYDGLRIQALLVPGFDIVEAFDRAATRMRRGWSGEYRHSSVLEIPVDRSREHAGTRLHPTPPRAAYPNRAGSAEAGAAFND
jgi:hypothetical protein